MNKVYLIPDERLFLDAGKLSEVATFPTDLGRVGALVCADSWVPRMYKLLESNEQHVDIITAGSFASPAHEWNEKWTGYNIVEHPSDVDKSDVGNALQKDMWKKVYLCLYNNNIIHIVMIE